MKNNIYLKYFIVALLLGGTAGAAILSIVLSKLIQENEQKCGEERIKKEKKTKLTKEEVKAVILLIKNLGELLEELDNFIKKSN